MHFICIHTLYAYEAHTHTQNHMNASCTQTDFRIYSLFISSIFLQCNPCDLLLAISDFTLAQSEQCDECTSVGYR